jgi:hypothetical protein
MDNESWNVMVAKREQPNFGEHTQSLFMLLVGSHLTRIPKFWFRDLCARITRGSRTDYVSQITQNHRCHLQNHWSRPSQSSELHSKFLHCRLVRCAVSKSVPTIALHGMQAICLFCMCCLADRASGLNGQLSSPSSCNSILSASEVIVELCPSEQWHCDDAIHEHQHWQSLLSPRRRFCINMTIKQIISSMSDRTSRISFFGNSHLTGHDTVRCVTDVALRYEQHVPAKLVCPTSNYWEVLLDPQRAAGLKSAFAESSIHACPILVVCHPIHDL